MDTVTYPRDEVAEAIARSAVPVRIDVDAGDEESRRHVWRFGVVWTPTLIWLTPDGREARRVPGYVPAGLFPAHVALAEAMALLLREDFAAAERAFREAYEAFRDTLLAPEALYWAGVAAWRGRNPQGLISAWNELEDRFPDSEWWSRCAFVHGG